MQERHRSAFVALQCCLLLGALCSQAFAGDATTPRDVKLVVTDSGQYILGGQRVALSQLRAKLRELKSKGEPIDLHVTGSASVDPKFIFPAMAIVQEEGLAKVGVISVAPTASGASAPAGRR